MILWKKFSSEHIFNPINSDFYNQKNDDEEYFKKSFYCFAF